MILDTIRRWFGGGSEPEEEPGQPGEQSEQAQVATATPIGGSVQDCAGGPPPGSEMLACQEALEWLYEFMDGELPDADAEKVDQHFKLCTACYPHLRLEENFRTRLQSAVGQSAMPDDARNRVMELLAKEEAGGG